MINNKFFKGLYTAVPTPFNSGKYRNDTLDFRSLQALINEQICAKVKGIVVAGSTGESASLSLEEYKSLIIKTVKFNAHEKMQIIAGVNANNILHAIEMAKIAEEAKVDGLMCITPYYNKPSQLGLIQYFTAIHDAVNLPIMLYSVPARTGIDFTDETILKLSSLPRILALKDAANDITRPLRLINKIKECFSFLSGNDTTAIAYNSGGGVGCVSVLANITPTVCNNIQYLTLDDKYTEARNQYMMLMNLLDVLFIETNPVVVKYILSTYGSCSAKVRLPLTELSVSNKKIINKATNTLFEIRKFSMNNKIYNFNF